MSEIFLLYSGSTCGNALLPSLISGNKVFQPSSVKAMPLFHKSSTKTCEQVKIMAEFFIPFTKSPSRSSSGGDLPTAVHSHEKSAQYFQMLAGMQGCKMRDI